MPEEDFRVQFTVPFGNSGPRHYFFHLVKIVRERLPHWVPPGFEEYVQQVSEAQVRRADQQVKWIQARVQHFVIERLREKLGEKFFDIGVPSPVYKKAHEKRCNDPAENRMPVENYLDFIDLLKIVENKEVWSLFEAVLSSPTT